MTFNKYMASLAIGVAVSAFAVSAASATSSTIPAHKVGICHATGSKTNPYVFIVVDKHAAAAHAKHQDGRDVIGVTSASACPKVAAAQATPTPSPTATPAPGKGKVLDSATTQAAPTTLPDTGASDLSALIGIPALFMAGRAYLRSRQA